MRLILFYFIFVINLYFCGMKTISRNKPPIKALVGNKGSVYDNSNCYNLPEAKWVASAVCSM
jgi:hypothetical protein